MSSISLAQDVPKLRGLSRTNLLEYRDTQGRIVQGSTKTDWEIRRKNALEGFQEIIGKLPGAEFRSDLNPKILEEVDCGSYVRRSITYQSQPGGEVPAYLCIPKSALQGKKAPAVLCLHPTENKIGYKVVVGLGGKLNRQYASELAERGFITLSPSYPLLANYQPNLKALQMSSGTLKAIWDNLRGLDYLESLPFVDKTKGFAVIGHSLGGHNAIFTAVFDERIKAVVSSCGFDSVLDYKNGNLKGYIQERYMLKMADHLAHPATVPWDYYELIACLAPRFVFVNAPKADDNFQWQSVQRIQAVTLQIFKLYDAEQHLQIRHPEADHDFPNKERHEAYQMIEQALR